MCPESPLGGKNQNGKAPVKQRLLHGTLKNGNQKFERQRDSLLAACTSSCE